MRRTTSTALFVALLLIVMTAPLAAAGKPTDANPGPGGNGAMSHWTFISKPDSGEWIAVGDHLSFQWTLKPFTLYDVMMGGNEVIEAYDTEMDVTSFNVNGGVFVAMSGDVVLARIVDSSSLDMSLNCIVSPRDNQFPPDPCDLEFPQGSEGYANMQSSHTSQFHIELPTDAQGLSPCIKATVQGPSSFDGQTIMFQGSMNFRMPPGLAMSEEI